jgi:hypothetical protein
MRTCSKSTGCRVATSTTKPQTSSSFDNLIFEPRHIRAEDIPEDQDKTPDFKLLKDGALRAYCEMKAPTDGDLFDVPDDLAPGEIRTEVRKDPTIFNLARHIAKAAKQLHYARVGVTAKTLANHRSNARAALRWFGREHDVPQRGLRLSARWARFCDRIDARMRDRLYSLVRYCSARGIDPSAVDDRILDEYWHYRTETTARASNNTARRFVVRAWNACAAAIDQSSLRRLTEPPIKVAKPAWGEFPARLRMDLDDYFAGLASPPYARGRMI